MAILAIGGRAKLPAPSEAMSLLSKRRPSRLRGKQRQTRRISFVWQAREENQPTPTAYWDGTFRGAIVPQGAYAWIANVTFQDGNKRVYKGTVTVLR